MSSIFFFRLQPFACFSRARAPLALPQRSLLFCLFVIRVLPARTAELSGLHTFGVLLLIFRGGVIAIFALTTLQSNDFAHRSIPFSSAGRGEPDRLWKITR
jgi:hypothetical protein